jgi:geranylgeranyl diphosphate synthase type II
MSKLNELLQELKPYLDEITSYDKKPDRLYQPINYILSIGGKRIRPAMVLAAYKLYNQELSEEVLQLSQVVEMFHNFTLLHDDIMDKATLRRGKPVVHEKWDESTAILSGDLLQILVYEKLTKIGNWEVLNLFNRMAIELCEGQMKDMDFESAQAVKNEDYLDMIRQKTAVLLGFCLQSGALLGGATQTESEELYNLGIEIGLAFQLMDDYLDAFGEKAKVGKRIGGDILEKKKTYLWNSMWEKLPPASQQAIIRSYDLDEEETIALVKQEMESSGAKNNTLALAESYSKKALNWIESLSVDGDKVYLQEIINLLAARQS